MLGQVLSSLWSPVENTHGKGSDQKVLVLSPEKKCHGLSQAGVTGAGEKPVLGLCWRERGQTG